MALITPFAENGNRATIPATTSDGSVSYDQGFGGFYALPPEEGGLFIDRAQFNQLMYDTTSQVLANKSNIATIQGDLTTAQSNITTLQQKTSNLENNVSTLETQATTGVGYLTQNITWNIGSGGDYTTIAEALSAASQYGTISNKRITLNLKSNYTGGEDLTPFRGDYNSIININGNNQNFNFSTYFIKISNILVNISNIKITGATQTAIEISNCPQVLFDSISINAGANLSLSVIRSKIIIQGFCNFTTTGETAIKAQNSIINIPATATYSSTTQNIFLDGGSLVYSFSPATANIAKNTVTRNGIFLN
ncbi:hypothetical protein [Campylobacter lanienae]|uniref:hypothetical protein n=1 Tax=Campylobacter lanienae TaxID=75658 RepID=UPI00243283B5|nr:hypothetical protein [Campylobacter lanienae]MDD5785989.1 hypothetical protein [Campylobacter lanienae]